MSKMTNIFNAHEGCSFEERKIFFDTNIWISIYGNDPRSSHGVYSDFYSAALKAGNEIVVNEFVISEYFNRVCKIEYELLFGTGEWSRYKARRLADPEFMERVESVRDTCLNILDDCIYMPASPGKAALSDCVESAAGGKLDLTDTFLVRQCREQGYVFVSHDGDFCDCGLDLVTANVKVLASSC